MPTILGENIPVNLHVEGFVANTWIWILVVALVGTLLIIGTIVLLYYKTYRRKVIVLDPNGWNVVLRSRARVIRLGPEGTELMKTFAGNHYLSAYGKKTFGAYLYTIGSDGYWYNVTLGDWDAKLGMVDIEPIDRDVRAQHKANAELIRNRYGDKNNWEKIAPYVFVFGLMIIFFIGMYITFGKMADATSNIGEAVKSSTQTAQANAEISDKLTGIVERLGVVQTQGTGMTPVPTNSS